MEKRAFLVLDCPVSTEAHFGNSRRVRHAAHSDPESAFIRQSEQDFRPNQPGRPSACVARPVDGVLDVWVGPKMRSRSPMIGIRFYQWTYDGRHLVYLQDEKGNENSHVYAVDPQT